MKTNDKLIEKLKRDLVVYMKGYKVESIFTEEEINLIIKSLESEQTEEGETFENLLDDIIKWQVETFGEATPLSKIRHLQKETDELADELADDLISSAYHGPENTMLRHEYADNFLLLFGSAMSAGFTFKDISNAMREKLEICKKREWGKPDKDGIVEHIRPASSLQSSEPENHKTADLKGKIATIISRWNCEIGNKYTIGQVIDDICELFASQSQPERISDEDIYKHANSLEFRIYDSFWDAWIDGAKALRDNKIK